MKTEEQIKKRINAMAMGYKAGVETKMCVGSYMSLMWMLEVEYLSVAQAELEIPRMVDARELNMRLNRR